MGEQSINTKRLTWNPVFPAPYESGWSIFAKLVALNNMSLNEVSALIQRDEIVVDSSNILNLADSSWIDFEKFSMLLDVGVDRLKTGFWDQVGAKLNVGSGYEIRHCPQCWALGYHCIFFDLTNLLSCPWHCCALTESCAKCATPSIFKIRSLPNTSNGLFCLHCGIKLSNFSNILSFKSIDKDLNATKEKYCSELIGWWKCLGQHVPFRDLLLADILSVGDLSRNRRRNKPLWQIAYALSVVKNIPGWSFQSSPIDARHANWPIGANEENPFTENPRIQSDDGRCYRSLRRYIYKRFIRPHRRCHGTLISYGHDECLTIDGEQICIVSLAFLVWRMSIEGLCNIEGLRYHRRNDFSLKFMGPNEIFHSSLLSRLQWSYFSFFGIWNEFSTLCGTRKFRVESSDMRCDEHLHWACSLTEHRKDRGLCCVKQAEFHILYPDSSPLVDRAQQRCLERRKLGRDMLDIRRYDNDCDYTWTGYNESNFRDCLFLVRNPNSLSKLQFVQVDV